MVITAAAGPSGTCVLSAQRGPREAPRVARCVAPRGRRGALDGPRHAGRGWWCARDDGRAARRQCHSDSDRAAQSAPRWHAILALFIIIVACRHRIADSRRRERRSGYAIRMNGHFKPSKLGEVQLECHVSDLVRIELRACDLLQFPDLYRAIEYLGELRVMLCKLALHLAELRQVRTSIYFIVGEAPNYKEARTTMHAGSDDDPAETKSRPLVHPWGTYQNSRALSTEDPSPSRRATLLRIFSILNSRL